MLSVVDFARDILKDYKVKKHPSSYGAVLFKAPEVSILLLHRGLVRFGDHKNQLTDNENLECCKLEGWFKPPTTKDDQLTIGISICKNRKTAGLLKGFWNGTTQEFSEKGYKAKMLKSMHSNSSKGGFKYWFGHLTVRGHGRDDEAIRKIKSFLEGRINIVKNNEIFYVQFLSHHRQRNKKQLRSIKLGINSAGGKCTAETKKEMQQWLDNKYSLPDNKIFQKIEAAICEQVQNIKRCSVGRVYYTDPDLSPANAKEAVLFVMKEVINSESQSHPGVSVGNQAFGENDMFFKDFKREYENTQLEWDILLPTQPFKDFYGKILWIFSCHTQLVQLLSYLYFVQNKDTVRSFLNELLEQEIPYILVNFNRMETTTTQLLQIYSERLDKLFQQSKPENKERLTYKLLNVHLLGCETVGFSQQDIPVNIMRRHWLTTNGTASSYQWRGTPEKDDPYYRHDDTHVPMYLLEPDTLTSSSNSKAGKAS